MPDSAAASCTHCGTARSGGLRFCTTCGHAYDALPPAAARSTSSAPPSSPAGQWSQPPRRPRPPFGTVDLLLVACLVLSLAVTVTLSVLLLTGEDPPTSVTSSSSAA
jgi:hypothetical protein